MVGNVTHFFKNAESVAITTTYESTRDNSIYDTNQLGSYFLVDVNYLKNIHGYDMGFKINNLSGLMVFLSFFTLALDIL